jgi:hypothetical protein
MRPELNFSRELHPNSRVWIYQTDRELNTLEIEQLSSELNRFIADWAAHGSGLFADFSFFSPYTLIVAVDDTKVPPSGCSIDALVRFLMKLGEKYQLDFFVRTNAVVFDQGQWKQQAFHEVDAQKQSLLIIDPTVATLHDFYSSGIVSPLNSGLKTLF